VLFSGVSASAFRISADLLTFGVRNAFGAIPHEFCPEWYQYILAMTNESCQLTDRSVR
jgi:hypothetical protein